MKVTCGQVWWPILGICALHLTHPMCTHTHSSEHTHTVNTHWEQWAAIYAATPGSSWGCGALLKGTSVVVLRVERALYIPPPPPPIHLNYSLAFRPRLPTNVLPVLNGKVPKQHGPAALPCVWSYLFLKIINVQMSNHCKTCWSF